MSSRTDRDHLTDILTAISAIRLFLVETSDFESYSTDLKTRSAVERQLQIVTEAAHRLGTDAEARFPGPNWSGWAGMGNILRHSYHRLDDHLIWNTVINRLPELNRDVTAALRKLDEPS